MAATATKIMTPKPAVQAATTVVKPLTPKEIQATFGTGTPFSSSTPSGTTYTVTLNSDGTASRLPHKGKVAITGKWRVSKDGYCSTWGKGTENCYKIEKDGDRYKVLDARAGVVAYWKTK
jgi:hypothetical protein